VVIVVVELVFAGRRAIYLFLAFIDIRIRRKKDLQQLTGKTYLNSVAMFGWLAKIK
jgi:capsular polysaccharide biosynthesis protein